MEIYDEYEDDHVNNPVEDEGEIFSEAEEDNTHNADDDTTTERKPEPVKVKRVVLNPQPKLNFQALQGPKGLLALNEQFENFKFRGKGYEKEDLGNILKKMEQWTFRLFPKFHFEDSLKRIESLGKKREVQVYLRKIRQGMLDNDDVVRQIDEDEAETEIRNPVEPVMAIDEFDNLLSQQISQNKPTVQNIGSGLSEEQRLRIERNKQLALEKKKIKEAEATHVANPSPTNIEDVMEVDEPSCGVLAESPA